MVERGSGIAVWRQIGESLADDIRNKLYLAGEQLPSEPELAAKFAVNRHTIRRAMGELEQSGLIRIEQGRGTFVQEHAIDYAIGKRTRFPRTCAARACWATWKRWAARRCAPPTSPSTWACRATAAAARASGGQGRKPAHQRVRTLLRRKRFPDFAERLTALKSVSKVYAHYGIDDYTRKWSRITAALPSPEVARLLGQPKTRPILQVEALNVDQQGAPCSTASPGSWGPGAADGQRRQLSTAWRWAGPEAGRRGGDRTNRANPLIHLDIWL